MFGECRDKSQRRPQRQSAAFTRCHLGLPIAPGGFVRNGSDGCLTTPLTANFRNNSAESTDSCTPAGLPAY
jgi:hypothetical protein